MAEERISAFLKVRDFLSKGPRYLLAYAAWRGRRLAASRWEGKPRWPSEDDLRRALRGDGGGAAGFRRALRARFSSSGPSSSRGSSGSPHILCRWEDRAPIVRSVPEACRARTIEEASAVAARRFRYRGRTVSFTGPIDWGATPDGNRDWSWDLNRHHFFVALGRAYWYTGDEGHAKAFVDLLRGWMSENAPGIRAPRWRSVFEVGVRAVNWCWAHALFLPSTSLDDETHADLLRGILAMGRFLRANVERHAWNNHLLLEARALEMLGLLYPDFVESEAWRALGGRLLGEQIARQILPDGVHSERSSLYQEIIASELLEHAAILRACGHDRDDPHLAAVERAWRALAGFLAEISRPDGSMPLLGDASRGDRHVRHDVLAAAGFPEGSSADSPEGNLWLFRGSRGPEPGAPGLQPGTAALATGTAGLPPGSAGSPGARGPRVSRAFADGGYYVLRHGAGDDLLHMVLDCGPFGDPVVRGHGHADALSIDVAVGGRHVLVDPGAYSSHLGARWRNFFRGTSAHNTVVIDGRDQTVLAGVRRAYRPAESRVSAWSTCEAFDVIAGEHDGYLRLEGAPIHRRLVFFRKPRYWLVFDRIDGRGAHRCDVLFHLHPNQTPRPYGETRGFVTRDGDGLGLAIVPLGWREVEAEILEGLGEGDVVDGPIQGWFAPQSGVRVPAPVVRYRREGAPPASLATFLFPLAGEDARVPRVEALAAMPAAAGDTEAHAAATVLFPGGERETVLVAAPGVDVRGIARAGALRSDARVAAVREGALREGTVREGAGGSPVAGVLGGALIGGSLLSWRGVDLVRADAARVDVAFELLDGHLRILAPGSRGAAPGSTRLVFESTGVETVTVDGVERRCERTDGGVAVRV